nr:MAG TPA: hypothetical protein [Caudoviricetes sp.]
MQNSNGSAAVEIDVSMIQKGQLNFEPWNKQNAKLRSLGG